MSMKKQVICFVDDDAAEIERFRKYLGDRFVIGAGQSIQQALDDLRNKCGDKPDLYVLDMYFPEGRLPIAGDLVTLQTAREKFLKAQGEFHALLARLGQTSEGGFRLARDIRQRTRRGFVFFTHKGTLNDAISAYEELGAISVILKPEPTISDIQAHGLAQAYDKALEGAAGLIAGKIERAIYRASWWGRYRSYVFTFVLGIITGLVTRAIWEGANMVLW